MVTHRRSRRQVRITHPMASLVAPSSNTFRPTSTSSESRTTSTSNPRRSHAVAMNQTLQAVDLQMDKIRRLLNLPFVAPTPPLLTPTSKPHPAPLPVPTHNQVVPPPPLPAAAVAAAVQVAPTLSPQPISVHQQIIRDAIHKVSHLSHLPHNHSSSQISTLGPWEPCVLSTATRYRPMVLCVQSSSLSCARQPLNPDSCEWLAPVCCRWFSLESVIRASLDPKVDPKLIDILFEVIGVEPCIPRWVKFRTTPQSRMQYYAPTPDQWCIPQSWRNLYRYQAQYWIAWARFKELHQAYPAAHRILQRGQRLQAQPLSEIQAEMRQLVLREAHPSTDTVRDILAQSAMKHSSGHLKSSTAPLGSLASSESKSEPLPSVIPVATSPSVPNSSPVSSWAPSALISAQPILSQSASPTHSTPTISFSPSAPSLPPTIVASTPPLNETIPLPEIPTTRSGKIPTASKVPSVNSHVDETLTDSIIRLTLRPPSPSTSPPISRSPDIKKEPLSPLLAAPPQCQVRTNRRPTPNLHLSSLKPLTEHPVVQSHSRPRSPSVFTAYQDFIVPVGGLEDSYLDSEYDSDTSSTSGSQSSHTSPGLQIAEPSVGCTVAITPVKRLGKSRQIFGNTPVLTVVRRSSRLLVKAQSTSPSPASHRKQETRRKSRSRVEQPNHSSQVSKLLKKHGFLFLPNESVNVQPASHDLLDIIKVESDSDTDPLTQSPIRLATHSQETRLAIKQEPLDLS
ncbi:hypothetical protein IWQ61_005825 [Dispira simplex]|nr:hypothetical protein IWQ61_005825 [Dispira simplex]